MNSNYTHQLNVFSDNKCKIPAYGLAHDNKWFMSNYSRKESDKSTNKSTFCDEEDKFKFFANNKNLKKTKNTDRSFDLANEQGSFASYANKNSSYCFSSIKYSDSNSQKNPYSERRFYNSDNSSLINFNKNINKNFNFIKKKNSCQILSNKLSEIGISNKSVYNENINKKFFYPSNNKNIDDNIINNKIENSTIEISSSDNIYSKDYINTSHVLNKPFGLYNNICNPVQTIFLDRDLDKVKRGSFPNQMYYKNFNINKNINFNFSEPQISNEPYTNAINLNSRNAVDYSSNIGILSPLIEKKRSVVFKNNSCGKNFRKKTNHVNLNFYNDYNTKNVSLKNNKKYENFDCNTIVNNIYVKKPKKIKKNNHKNKHAIINQKHNFEYVNKKERTIITNLNYNNDNINSINCNELDICHKLDVNAIIGFYMNKSSENLKLSKSKFFLNKKTNHMMVKSL